MIKNIYAFTEEGSDYPGFVSLNDNHGDEVVLTLRGRTWEDEFGRRVPGATVSLPLDEEQLRELWRNLYVHLSRKKT